LRKARTNRTLLSAVGRRIIELRCERGLSQRQLALAAGISPSHLSLIESGKRWPLLVTLVEIAEVLDVAAVDLLPAGRR
jgi:transcriptional regulator with XRE-family HTH domain